VDEGGSVEDDYKPGYYRQRETGKVFYYDERKDPVSGEETKQWYEVVQVGIIFSFVPCPPPENVEPIWTPPPLVVVGVVLGLILLGGLIALGGRR